MLLLLIIVPCTFVAVAAVLMADRLGWLPRLDKPLTPRPSHSSSAPLAVGAIVLMGAWILVWLVVLAIGLNFITKSG
jgi:Zn-dependent protease with chaperone function